MPSRLGQNFLASPAWRRRVLDAIAARAGDRIVEIGGGRGELSIGLAAAGAALLIVELDPGLAAELRRRFASCPRVAVRQADVRELDLAAALDALDGPGPGRRLVVGNLPYYISSPILAHLCRYSSALDEAVVMLQKEVAGRVASPPGHRAYGLLSAWVQAHALPEPLFDLPPGAFRPAPKVSSTLLRLRFAPQLRAWGIDDAGFLLFLRAAFAGKRKRLWNNLKPRYGLPRLQAAWRLETLSSDLRAEALAPAALASLYRRLEADRSGGA